MTLELFQFLTPTSQMAWVMQYATYIAHRREGKSFMTLFHFPSAGGGFLAEVGIDEAWDSFVLLRSFRLTESLDEYAVCVRLPTL
jgi:hypothetical protein